MIPPQRHTRMSADSMCTEIKVPHCVIYTIMAYGSTPYVGMAPNKNGGHIKSAHMTRSKCRDGVKVLWCHFHLVWLVF